MFHTVSYRSVPSLYLSRVAVPEWQHVTATSYLWQAGCKWCRFKQRHPRWCHSFGSTVEEMPAGLLGGLCKGREEDRDGLRNWEDTCHERVGGQHFWKGFLSCYENLPEAGPSDLPTFLYISSIERLWRMDHLKEPTSAFPLFPKQFLGLDHSAFTCFAGPVCSRLPWLLQSGYRSQQEDWLWSTGLHSCQEVCSSSAEVDVRCSFCGWSSP